MYREWIALVYKGPYCPLYTGAREWICLRRQKRHRRPMRRGRFSERIFTEPGKEGERCQYRELSWCRIRP